MYPSRITIVSRDRALSQRLVDALRLADPKVAVAGVPLFGPRRQSLAPETFVCDLASLEDLVAERQEAQWPAPAGTRSRILLVLEAAELLRGDCRLHRADAVFFLELSLARLPSAIRLAEAGLSLFPEQDRSLAVLALGQVESLDEPGGTREALRQPMAQGMTIQ